MTIDFTAGSPAAKLQASYQNLSTASNALNTVSDKLGAAARALDDAITKLNPGVEAWIRVSQTTPDDDAPLQVIEERLGFAKISGRWGLSLRLVRADETQDHEEILGDWLFNDGPRDLRIKAIEYVPNLVDALAKKAAETAEVVGRKADAALELANTLGAIAALSSRTAGKK
jgi:hypothetical protein